MSMKSLILGAVLALSVLVPSTQAAVITFENTVLGEHPGLVEYTEAGFTHSVQTGGLFVSSRGNLGKAMEGSVFYEGGILDIVAADNSLFTFQGVDFAAYGPLDEAQFLWVEGLREGASVGFEFFLLDNTLDDDPTYANWTTFGAKTLAGQNIDKLSITLAAGSSPSEFRQAIDNVTLGPSAVPEPSTWAMMILGFGLAGAVLRRRRQTPLAA